jgi:hypothetical protein
MAASWFETHEDVGKSDIPDAPHHETDESSAAAS